MLRDVVVHILNEQPLRADMLFEPLSTDNVLVCRNLRTMNGKKPIMADHIDSLFVIPLTQVRFVEISQESLDAHDAEYPAAAASGTMAEPAGHGDASSLKRPAMLTDGRRRTDAPAHPAPAADDVPDHLDDDLLRRIREV
jgi:hypothetical protein